LASNINEAGVDFIATGNYEIEDWANIGSDVGARRNNWLKLDGKSIHGG